MFNLTLYEGHATDPVANVPNDEVLRAMRVCSEIDEWLEKHNSSGYMPCAVLTITNGMLAIQIGDVGVWDTETSSGDEELTLEVCLREYREYIDTLRTPFVEQAAAEAETPDHPIP